jgi:class 3 adenylate cyclase
MPCTAAVRGVVATCPLPTTESSNAVAIAVPVAASLVVLVVCGAVAAWWFRVHRDVRDVDNAPKAAPLTLMFTDIQSSTRLWSVAPASMAAALDAHHQLIRKCLVRHGGYEVKTVGDSFMIAVREASAAVAIAVDIQREFQRYRFPRAIRAIYEATDEGIDEIDDDPEALDDLHPLWNGLRVRVGIHTGDAGIVFDEVSKGYDYYGPHVNVAARVEASACGGQIHATEAALANLPTREDVVYVHLGARELRGVSDPVVLWEIIPTELRARDFSAQKVRQEDSAAAHEKAAPLLPHLPPQHAADCVSQASHGSSSALRVDDVSFQTAGVKLFIAVTLLALRMFPRKQQLDIARDIAIAWRLRPAELVACEAPSDYLARVGRRVDTTVIKYMRASAADGTSPMEAAPVANPLAQSLKHSPALTPQIQYIRSSASAAETTVLEV